MDTPSLPPVVAVMVIHELGEWLPETLRGLASQDYASLQHLILVTGSADDPQQQSILDLVATEIPSAVVRFLGGNPGYGAACNSVLDLVQGESGFFCFLHDDVALAPDVISRLLEELLRSNAGVVGPKFVHWDDSRMIQSVGIAVDRFGVEMPYADDGEIDQEQHDAVQDVFVVSSASMLVRADLFRTVGGFQPELASAGTDLDFCWRCHTTGARVVVVPEAIVRHRESMNTVTDEDVLRDMARDAEKTRVATVASLTPIGMLPFVLMQMIFLTLARLVMLLVSGKVTAAYAELSAWVALPFAIGDVRRRRDAVSQHRVVDGSEIRALQIRGSAYVASYFRRRARRAGLAQADSSGVVQESAPRAAYVMWSVLIAVLIIGSRTLLSSGVVAVGQMAPIAGSARELAASYASGWWGTGFGQVSSLPTGSVLTAVGAIGTLGNTGLLHTLGVVLLPLIGWIGIWRFASVMGNRGARISATVAYAAVPLSFAAIAAGRWGALFVYALLPWMMHLSRMLVGHADIADARAHEAMVNVSSALWRRWFAGLTLLIAITFAFEPGVIVVLPMIAVVMFATCLAQGMHVKWASRWIMVVGAALVAALVLNLPWTSTYVRSGWWEALTGAAIENGRELGLLNLMHFSIGEFSVGSVSLLLYAAVIGAVLLVRGPRAVWALRGASLVVVGVLVAVLDDAALMPAHLPEPAVMLVVVAFGIAVSAGTMGASLVLDLGRGRFSWRQPLGALVALAFMAGTFPVAVNTVNGRWNQPSLALPQLLAQLPDEVNEGGYRTMFIGDARVLPGAAINLGWGVSYSIVNGPTPTMMDQWETPPTRARDTAVAALYGIVRGQTARAGRLLAPLSVRFIVVPIIDGGQSTRDNPIAAPRGLVDALSRQLDLRRRYASPDLVIYENDAAVPVRSVLTSVGTENSKLAGVRSMIARNIGGATPLPAPARPEAPVRAQVDGPATVHLSVPFTSEWKLTVNNQDVPARPAFGLTNAYDISESGTIDISFRSSNVHTATVLIQFVVWCLVLFVALSRRRRSVPRVSGAVPMSDGPVIMMNEGIKP
jgi:GT2 family glycosyltransferase